MYNNKKDDFCQDFDENVILNVSRDSVTGTYKYCQKDDDYFDFAIPVAILEVLRWTNII